MNSKLIKKIYEDYNPILEYLYKKYITEKYDIEIAAVDVSESKIYVNPAARLRGPEMRFVIAHESAEQPCVGGRNAVMRVDIQLGERRNIDAEFILFIDAFGKFRIEGVNAFDHDQLILADGGDPFAENLDAVDEIEFRQIHFFAA